MNHNITHTNQKIIQNVIANMRLEGMELTEDDIHRMERVLNGESTIEDEINKLLIKYKKAI